MKPALQSPVKDLIEWAEDAAHLLTLYLAYAERMRTFGKGYTPSGLAGHSAEDVVRGLLAAIRKVEGA